MTTDSAPRTEAPASPEREALTERGACKVLTTRVCVLVEGHEGEHRGPPYRGNAAAQPSADVVGAEVRHALDALNDASDKMMGGDSPVSDLLEAHTTLDSLLEALAAAREAGPPAAREAGEGLRLLRELTDAVDGAPEDDYWTDKREPGNKPWNEARAYLDAHPEPTAAPTRRTSDAG